MKTEIIKPKKEKKESMSILTPIIYLIVGIMLAFKSNEAVKFIFYIIAIFVVLYGIKSFIICFQMKDEEKVKNIHLTMGIISVIMGILIFILSEALEVSIRYILGFFFIYMGISRLISQIGLKDYKNFSMISNIVLIILGLYSIFVSNAVLVVIGWLLVVNAILLFWDYLKN